MSSWDEPKKEKFDWTKNINKNYLIYGESKTGKTFVATYKIKQMLGKNPEAKAYIFNTDNGFTQPALQNGLDKFAERIVYFPITDLQDTIVLINELKGKVKPHDIILFDLVSWVWDESQKEFINQMGGSDVVNFVKRSMQDDKKFGMFTGIQWQFIKKLDDMITSVLAKYIPCTVICLARVKNIEMEYTISKKKPDVWMEMGRPDGRKDMMYEFSNIIRLIKNEKDDRQFMIMGTRDKDSNYQLIDFKTAEEFWNKVEGEGKNE